eukprot:1367718-Amphidinium_carterae.1
MQGSCQTCAGASQHVHGDMEPQTIPYPEFGMCHQDLSVSGSEVRVRVEEKALLAQCQSKTVLTRCKLSDTLA